MKLLKLLSKTVPIWIILIGIMYVSFSIGNSSFHFNDWSHEARNGLGFLFAFISVAMVVWTIALSAIEE